MRLDHDIPVPRKVGKHPALAKPTYERFLCLNGDMEGRGLIVPVPSSYACGYELMTLKDGTNVAIQKGGLDTA